MLQESQRRERRLQWRSSVGGNEDYATWNAIRRARRHKVIAKKREQEALDAQEELRRQEQETEVDRDTSDQ